MPMPILPRKDKVTPKLGSPEGKNPSGGGLGVSPGSYHSPKTGGDRGS